MLPIWVSASRSVSNLRIWPSRSSRVTGCLFIATALFFAFSLHFKAAKVTSILQLSIQLGAYNKKKSPHQILYKTSEKVYSRIKNMEVRCAWLVYSRICFLFVGPNFWSATFTLGSNLGNCERAFSEIKNPPHFRYTSPSDY